VRNHINVAVYHILTFCEGHVRADLRVKVRVPVRQIVADLGEKLVLEQHYTVYPNGCYTYFVNKKIRLGPQGM
jgi:hypothetical protein